MIRKAELKDTKELAKLYIQFWKNHEGYDPLHVLKEKPNIKNQSEVAKKDLKKRTTYIFVYDDKGIKGYIELLINKEKDYTIQKHGYINSITIDKKHRGKGIAKALVEHAFEFFKSKDIEYVKLNVYNVNKPATQLWKKLGFKSISSIRLKKI